MALSTGHRVFSLWRGIASILLLDYTLYIWHVLTHRVPFLWRFHLPHHVDLDLDASTALRFHFGEMMLAVPYRLLQVTLFGIDYRTYSIWQTFLFACILFHHSNLRLPPGDGAQACVGVDDTASTRDPSRCRLCPPEFELVERIEHLGPAAWDVPGRCSAGEGLRRGTGPRS